MRIIDSHNFHGLGLVDLLEANRAHFPTILDLGNFPELKRLVNNGKPAYIRGNKKGIPVMLAFEPREEIVVARVVPAIHFVSGHNHGKVRMENPSKLEALCGILRFGFHSKPQDDNAYLLSQNFQNEAWKLGYPYGNSPSEPMSKSYAMNKEDGLADGDSARVVCWTGIVTARSYNVRRSTDIRQNKTCIYDVPVDWIEGVVVTEPNSNWEQRVDFYTRLHRQKQLIAPIHLYNVYGTSTTIEQMW